MTKFHQNSSSSEEIQDSSSVSATMQASSERDSEPDKCTGTIQQEITDFKSVSSSATADGIPQILTQPTSSVTATTLYHQSEMMTRYLRQSVSEEPFVVFARTMHENVIKAVLASVTSQGLIPDDIISVTQGQDDLDQMTGRSLAERLQLCLHQAAKNEPIYAFENTSAAGEISSPKSV